MQLPPLPAPAATRHIIRAIRDEDARLLAAWPLLGRDDLVAFGFWVLSFVGIAVAALLFLQLGLPWPLAVVAVAFCTATLHELEHDLIHELYFDDRPALRQLVLFSIWLGKGSLDPWSRGRIHRFHHAVSGQDEDVEERLIGLGLPWGWRRALVTLSPVGSALLVPEIIRAVRARAAEGGPRLDISAPVWWPIMRAANVAIFGLPALLLILALAGQGWAWSVIVLWVLPNMLRHSAIVLMSSNSHYMGIPRSELALQNQILDHWVFWPAQLFCWNFGATHVLHHFVVKQPFWRRTLAFRRLRPTLVANGMPTNDLWTFARANYRGTASPAGMRG